MDLGGFDGGAKVSTVRIAGTADVPRCCGQRNQDTKLVNAKKTRKPFGMTFGGIYEGRTVSAAA
jgi:hypothetical protein